MNIFLRRNFSWTGLPCKAFVQISFAYLAVPWLVVCLNPMIFISASALMFSVPYVAHIMIEDLAV